MAGVSGDRPIYIDDLLNYFMCPIDQSSDESSDKSSNESCDNFNILIFYRED